MSDKAKSERTTVGQEMQTGRQNYTQYMHGVPLLYYISFEYDPGKTQCMRDLATGKCLNMLDFTMKFQAYTIVLLLQGLSCTEFCQDHIQS
jgi:hypothetical protein